MSIVSKKSAHVNFYMDKSRKKDIEKIAKKLDMPLSALLRQIIDEYIVKVKEEKKVVK